MVASAETVLNADQVEAAGALAWKVAEWFGSGDAGVSGR